MAHIKEEKHQQPKDAQRSLAMLSTMKTMMEKKELTDVVLVCDGGKIEAHRLVLSAASPFFKDMFIADFKESNTGTVNFTHVDLITMQLIVDYVYSHNTNSLLTIDVDGLIRVFQNAHMFQIKDLADICWKLIGKGMDRGNWFSVWEVRNLHLEKSERCKVMEFLIWNLHKIIDKDQFLNLDEAQMLKFLEEVQKNNIPIDDHFLGRILEWSEVNQKEEEFVEDLLMEINYDFVSKEFMEETMKAKENIFADKRFKKFFEFQFLPKLKSKQVLSTKTEIQGNPQCLVLSSPIKQTIQIKFLFFGCYQALINDIYVYEKMSLRIFDSESKTLQSIEGDDLPFRCFTGILPFEFKGKIYIIGGIVNGDVEPTRTNTLSRNFYSYDLEGKSISRKESLLVELRYPFVCVHNSCIYCIGNNVQTGEIVVQCYHNDKWKVKNCSVKHQVVACVGYADVVFVLCWKTGTIEYSFYAFNCKDSTLGFHCQMPVEAYRYYNSYVNVIYQESVILFKDKIIIVRDRTFEWYIFNIKSKIWTMNQPICGSCVVDNSCRYFLSKYKTCIMVYNENMEELCRYNEETNSLELIMTVQGSPEANYYEANGRTYEKYETLLII